MQTLEGLRRRIGTAQDLRSVVSTMKTLAAVSIRQYETAVEALVEYNRTIELGFQIVLRSQRHYWANQHETHNERTGVIVFGTDQGMCGQFNEAMAMFVQTCWQQASADPPWLLLVVGARAESYLREAGFAVEHTEAVPSSISQVTELVQDLLPHIVRWQSEQQITRLLVLHHRRTSVSSYEPQRLQLLPIDPERFRFWSEQPWQSNCLPLFTMDVNKLRSSLIQQYLFVSLFRACAESLASENASRIAAMQAAENNIEERIDDLQGAWNRLRQSAITEELLDVITGFEALANQPRSPS